MLMKRRQRTDAYKIKTATYVRARRRFLKDFYVRKFGGKCSICGYDKCVASLAFHHRDPSQKEASWATLSHMSIAAIEEELEKCDLVCHNCHSEIHFDAPAYSADVKWFESVIMVEREMTPCKNCGKPFQKKSPNMVFCGSTCKKQHSNKKYPDNFNELVLSLGKSAVARMCGVSQRAVAKKFKKCLRGESNPPAFPLGEGRSVH